MQNGFWSITIWLAFIPSISCRSTWKSFMSTMENMNKLSGMQTDTLFTEMGFCDYQFGRWALFWGVGRGCTYKTWKNCELTGNDTLPWLHLTQLLKTSGGKCYRKCFSPFRCFWRKKGRASVITTNPVMTKQREKKTSGNHKDSEDRNKDKGRKETSKQHTSN